MSTLAHDLKKFSRSGEYAKPNPKARERNAKSERAPREERRTIRAVPAERRSFKAPPSTTPTRWRARWLALKASAQARRGYWVMAMSAALILAIGIAISFAINAIGARYVITDVSVNGEFDHLKEEELQSVIMGSIYGRGYFDLDPETIVARLESMPWVADAAVRKRWPGSLTISVQEKTAVAQWNDNGVISHRGAVFEPSDIDALTTLPRLYGPQGRTADIMDFYHQLSGLLQDLQWQVAVLRYDERGEWYVETRHGVQMRMLEADALNKLYRFRAFYLEGVAGRKPWVSTLGSVDLRYPNGVAIAPMDKG